MAEVDTIQRNAEEPLSEKVHAPGETLYSRKSIGKRILGLLWDSLDEKSPEEHRLVRRLDSFYLIWACFYYFVMYLDSSMWTGFPTIHYLANNDPLANISNAYVSGMKEDLNMYGNQLNYLTTYWTIGTVKLLDPGCTAERILIAISLQATFLGPFHLNSFR